VQVEVDARAGDGVVSRMPNVGDVGILGTGAPPEFRRLPAIVSKVSTSHCTVVVLDEERRVGIGECWPAFCDLTIESQTLRLGTRVVVEGMQGMQTRRLNGLIGVVSSHPREGHPVFIRKSDAEHPKLVVCILFDSAQAAGRRSALIEPRFLAPHGVAVEHMSSSLACLKECLAVCSRETVASVTAPAEGFGEHCADAVADSLDRIGAGAGVSSTSPDCSRDRGGSSSSSSSSSTSCSGSSCRSQCPQTACEQSSDCSSNSKQVAGVMSEAKQESAQLREKLTSRRGTLLQDRTMTAVAEQKRISSAQHLAGVTSKDKQESAWRRAKLVSRRSVSWQGFAVIAAVGFCIAIAGVVLQRLPAPRDIAVALMMLGA